MNRDDIIRMAHEADCLDEQHYGEVWVDKLTNFAELVAAAEREACAKVCDEVRDVIGRSGDVVDKPDCWCAAAIRVRGAGEQ
jgi:hypothetical protein